MKFEYDQQKNTINKRKHGMDFEEARELFEDPKRIEIPARVQGESRYLVVGKIREITWSAVITYRGANIRFISVRRAREEEVNLYENWGV